jgi:hypothetical protein
MQAAKQFPVMPANAGIRRDLGEVLDSRLRGNDMMIGCASV